MSKLSYNDKIKLYNDKINGMSINDLSKKYNIRISNVNYLTKLIYMHGFNILKNKNNHIYTKEFKREAIERVLLNNEAIRSVSLDIGLPGDGILHNWIKKYKENGYNIVEQKKGQSTMYKVINKKKKETKDETIKRLEEENLYLKAEIEYSKKLRAVVLARKNQQQKKK